MQTKYILPSLALLFIVNSTPTLATNTTITPSPRPTGWRQEIREDRRELKEDLKENRLELRRKRVQAVYDEIVKSLNLRLKYYQDMKAKIQTRITDRSATKNTTEAQNKLNEFDPIVTQFNTDLAAINTKFQEVLASDKPLTKLGELKTTANAAKNDLQNLRKVLTDTIRLLVKSPAKS